MLTGTNLAGMSTTRKRVRNDYYATPYETTESLLNIEKFKGSFLEPCVGGGHIVDIIKKYYPHSNITCLDLVDRKYPNTIVHDFLTYKFDKKFDNIITNPPFSLAQKFFEKSINIINNDGKIAMFLKIQFLESERRKILFKKYPPKYVYVFSKRVNPWRNGSPTDEKGKPWSGTMCFAWFVWYKNSNTEPIIRWI